MDAAAWAVLGRRAAASAASTSVNLPSLGRRSGPSRSDDVAARRRLVHELAEYERAPEQCHAHRRASSRTRCSAPAPALFGHVAFVDDDGTDGRRLRAVVPELLDLARRARALPRGPLRAARATGAPGSAGRCSRGSPAVCVERGLRPAGVGGAGLERARRSASTARWAPSPMDEWTVFRLDGAALERWPRRLSRLRSSSYGAHRPRPRPLADQQQERRHDETPAATARAAAVATARSASRRPAAARTG